MFMYIYIYIYMHVYMYTHTSALSKETRGFRGPPRPAPARRTRAFALQNALAIISLTNNKWLSADGVVLSLPIVCFECLLG